MSDREAFEASIRKRYPRISLERVNDEDDYCHSTVSIAYRSWQAAKQSMQGEAKKLHMVEPDYRLIGCANCGSHDVGAGHTIAHCYGCKDKVQGESFEDTIEKWNNKQLATLATHAPDSAALIAEQSAEIARLQKELEEARKALQFYADGEHKVCISPWLQKDGWREDLRAKGFWHYFTDNDDHETWIETGQMAESAIRKIGGGE